ncbi:hypothetical protein ACFVWY_12005 [Streptomyces sp. NPDC058195]|uniref:hypothetical protein n=1 Tax=Streptomyces sp. NPDC058195 TaxID=3346375 RepID=UPI0036F07D43
MKQLKRAAAVLTSVVLAGTGLALTTTPASAARAGTASAIQANHPKVDVYFAYSSWSHESPDSKASTHVGTLGAGKNYVYCFVNGETYTDKGHTSTVWLMTDDDSGNADVYVSRVYLTDGSYNVDLPRC